MAGPDELDKFVRKFVTLWQSGCDANLYVETKAGNAFVNLRVGLGQAHPHHGQHVGGHRGGGPAKQQRLERRAAARKATAAAAEKAAVDANHEQGKVEEETLEKKKADEAEDASEKVTNSPIPQVDGPSDRNICYEFKVEAHETCTHEDIMESIEANFLGCLDDEKVEKDAPLRELVVRKSKDNSNEQNIRLYEVRVIENEIVNQIIESWNTPYTFDDLAFKNAVRDEIVINILEVQRLR